MSDIIQKLANSFARSKGYGSATKIVFEDIDQPEIISHTPYGYRKYTTGEYVPKAYVNNFGWKNTYYQHAETVVALPLKTNP